MDGLRERALSGIDPPTDLPMVLRVPAYRWLISLTDNRLMLNLRSPGVGERVWHGGQERLGQG